MLQDDAHAGAFKMDLVMNTHNDVSAGINVVKRMYPESYVMRLHS